MKIVKKIFLCAVAVPVLMFAESGTVVKKWETVPAKDVFVSVGSQYRSVLKMSRKVLSKDGKPCIGVSIQQVPPEGNALGLVLKFEYQGEALKGGEEYEVSFLCKASAPCKAEVAVAMGGNPSWKEFNHGRRTVNFTERWQQVKIPFIPVEDASAPLNLPRVMAGECPAGTKLYFDKVTLKRLPKVLPLNLNPEWKVFQPKAKLEAFIGSAEHDLYSKVPAELSGAAPKNMRLENNVIDLGKNRKDFTPGECAYFFNRFESPADGEMHIGLAADWWFTLYVNGERVYDTQATGNRSKRFVPDDHVVAVPVKKGVNVLAVKVLSGSNGWKFVCGKPTRAPRNKEAYTLVENEDWRKVVVPPCVKPGTVLDFSSLGFIDAPAGKYGRVVVRGSHFEFENRPGVPVRFYGTNIYGHINFSDRAGAERLASMLARYGYNAVRIHHYDRMLARNPESGFTDLDPEKLDALNYLVKCLKDRGIYLLLDLHTTRLGLLKKSGQSILYEEECRRNWEKFSANLLNSVNPHTGIAWKDEPAMIGICPVNENSPFFFMGISGDLNSPYFRVPAGLSPDEKKRRIAKSVVESQKKYYPEICGFLRGLGVRAPLTDQNVSSTVSMTLIRNSCDYVDNHFYWAHTSSGDEGSKYIQSVPTESAMKNLIGSDSAFYPPDAFASRLIGKPYMISEFNFCAANQYRAEGGALVGAYAAMQDWDALFRYGFAEHPAQLMNPEWQTVGFDTVGDPMKFLSDRLGILLFLRGDVRKAKELLPISVPDNYTDSKSRFFTRQVGGVYPPVLKNWGFVSRIGSKVANDGLFSAETDEPEGETVEKIRSYLKTDAGMLDLNRKFAKSSTGELTLDGGKGVFLIDTPKTAAVVSVDAVNGSAGVLNVNIHKGFALVSASAMDGKILKESGKILLFHLTNVQNFNQRFSDSTLALMETWGAPQHVVRRGVADVELTLTPGETPRVYGVDLFGERIGEVPSKFNSSTGKLLFTADTFALKHPCMVYEIVR